jgi:hypothetical protein
VSAIASIPYGVTEEASDRLVGRANENGPADRPLFCSKKNGPLGSAGPSRDGLACPLGQLLTGMVR